MSSNGKHRKSYQTTWNDLEPWVAQLHESHGVVVHIVIQLEGMASGLKPAVRALGRRWVIGDTFTQVFDDWRTFDQANPGEAEHLALYMLSKALLALDNDKWLAEQGQSSLFD
jgi:hypothetical protein